MESTLKNPHLLNMFTQTSPKLTIKEFTLQNVVEHATMDNILHNSQERIRLQH